LIHDMVFNFKKGKPGPQNPFMKKLANTAYMLSIKEWNLDQILYRNLWSPFKWLGNQLRHINSIIAIICLTLLLAFGIYVDLNPEIIPASVFNYLPILFSFVGLILLIKSFAERNSAEKAWISIIGAQLFITLSIAIFHDNFGYDQVFIYLSGALICSVGGYLCLKKIKSLENDIDLNQFYGHAYEHPVLSFLFLISCLGMVGFPFTPTFIGIDLLFSHIDKQEIILIIFLALSFVFMEIAVLRIYARLFLGQHKKGYHPIAYRSS
ncbi:MAG: proton-conducting transporter transmembrane domain-containing protein, partial [Flavisolibacter sp.]